MDKTNWSLGIDSEFKFWADWLSTKGGQWPEDYDFRTRRDVPLQSDLAAILAAQPGHRWKILDVGAGPMTILGKVLDGHALDITAVDALAYLYDRLPFPPGLPIVRTKQCESERLSEHFGHDVFDITHARNTLDHSYDPIEAFRQMVAVTKPGGSIVTAHSANEAVNENWAGFHQWNFHISGNDLLISNKSNTTSLRQALGDSVVFAQINPDNSDWVYCVLTKQ